MPDELYRVILYCSQSNTDLIEGLKKGILRRLNLNKEDQGKLFGGQPIVIQNLMSRHEAEECKQAIVELGGVCEIEPESLMRDIDALGFIERRINLEQRAYRERRGKDRGSDNRRKGDRRRWRSH